MVADESSDKLRRSLLAPRKQIVDERRVRTDEDVILNRDAIPQLDATLNRYAISERYVVLNEDVIGNLVVSAKHGARKYMSESPHPRPRPNRWRLDQSRWMDERTALAQATSCQQWGARGAISNLGEARRVPSIH
jgi:hypothetical protein